MIETICDPFGKAAFPQVVKCDGCGEEIDCNGWVATLDGEEFHVCDDCAPQFSDRHEFRICDACGLPMDAGMTNEGNGLGADFHCHEECFEKAMDERYGKGCWRLNESGFEGANGGYYDERLEDGTWEDTGIFYTEWY